MGRRSQALNSMNYMVDRMKHNHDEAEIADKAPVMHFVQCRVKYISHQHKWYF